MKAIKVFILVSVFIAFAQTLQAQNNNQAETQRLTNLLQKLEGTYQIQVIDSREKIAFPLTALDIIEAKRQQMDTVYFWMKERVRIMVLPVATLSKNNFVAPERIKYMTETK